MTIRRWVTFAAAAAMLAGVSACKDSGGGSGVGNRTSSGASPGSTDSTQGRRPEALPRARGADAGSDMATGSSSTTSPSSNTTTSPSGSQDVTGSSGATSGRPSDATGAGSTGANTPSDSSKR